MAARIDRGRGKAELTQQQKDPITGSLVKLIRRELFVQSNYLCSQVDRQLCPAPQLGPARRESS